MIYKQEASDIIKALCDSLTFLVTIKSVTNDGGGKHTIKTCDMYHAQPGLTVTIGGKDYKITDIIPGTFASCGSGTLDKLVIKGDPANITAQTFSLYPLHFFHATPMAQGMELAQKNKAVDKMPMSWLYEQFTSSFNEDPMSNIEQTIKFRLFFLTQANPDEWLTDQSYKEAVKPMRRLAENFIGKIQSQSWRFDSETMEYDILNYAKFGVFIANRGMDKQLWHDKVGGVELSMTLTVFRSIGCDDCES